METTPEKKCAICGKECVKSCSSCKSVYYCSLEHQKLDWKTHKKNCGGVFKVGKNAQLGRHFVAKRNIPGGSLILKEYPALITLSDSTPVELMGKSSQPNCFACGRRIIYLEDCWCPSCHLPICCAKCAMANQHADYECRYFTEKGLQFPPLTSGYDFPLLMGMLGCIRAIGIKKYNAKLWAELSKLQADFPHMDTKSFYPEIVQDIFEIFQCLGFERNRFEELYDAEVVTKISGILLINAFHTYYPEDNGKYCQSIIKRLYAKISLMSHSCFPNAIRRVGPGPEFEMKIYAARDIAEGEIISSCYPENFQLTFKGAFQRQLNSMKDNREFFCRCTRCLDPTEKQTFLSALKCPQNMDLDDGKNGCPAGFMLIEDPTKLNSDWICNTCGFKWATKKVRDIIEDLEKAHKLVDFEDLTSAKKFLAQLKEKCHPNFWLVMKCEEQIVEQFVRSAKIDDLDLDTVTFLFDLLKHIVEVLDSTIPGLFMYRVQFMVDLFKVIKIKHQLIRKGEVVTLQEDKMKRRELVMEILTKIEAMRDHFLVIYEDVQTPFGCGCALYAYMKNQFRSDEYFEYFEYFGK